jgi:hypothetical protein
LTVGLGLPLENTDITLFDSESVAKKIDINNQIITDVDIYMIASATPKPIFASFTPYPNRAVATHLRFPMPPGGGPPGGGPPGGGPPGGTSFPGVVLALFGIVILTFFILYMWMGITGGEN